MLLSAISWYSALCRFSKHLRHCFKELFMLLKLSHPMYMYNVLNFKHPVLIKTFVMMQSSEYMYIENLFFNIITYWKVLVIPTDCHTNLNFLFIWKWESILYTCTRICHLYINRNLGYIVLFETLPEAVLVHLRFRLEIFHQGF